MNFFPSLPLCCVEVYHAVKALYQCNCATAAVAAKLVAAVALQVQYGPQTEGRIPQRVSGLSHDSMCVLGFPPC